MQGHHQPCDVAGFMSSLKREEEGARTVMPSLANLSSGLLLGRCRSAPPSQMVLLSMCLKAVVTVVVEVCKRESPSYSVSHRMC